MTRAELEGRGLVAPAPLKPEAQAFPDPPRRLAWPSYERCLDEALNRGSKRTSADFTFCCIAINHFKETAAKLLECRARRGRTGRPTRWTRRCARPRKVAVNPRSATR
jgi:hypothetical protein